MNDTAKKFEELGLPPSNDATLLAEIEKALEGEGEGLDGLIDKTYHVTELTGMKPPITWRDDLRVQEAAEKEKPPTPANVQRMCDALVTQWSKTADECEARAEALERVASELHHRATVLRNACGSLPQDIVEMVHHEIESSERAQSTVDVNPI